MKNMKKIMMVVVLCFVIVLSGCSSGDRFNNPVVMDETYQEAIKIVDENDYGLSVWKEAELIGNTIEKKRKINVYLLYKYNKNEVRTETVPVVEGMNVIKAQGDWCRYYRYQLVIDFANALEKYKLPSNGEVIGAIIEWSGVNEQLPEFSVCDIDGDARWDFVANSYGGFGDSSSIPEDDKVAVNLYEWVAFLTGNKYQKVTYENDDDILTFKDLEAKF